ncbi:MAG: HAD-IIIA family hydrolase [Acidobacteriota bacterium]
MARGGNVAGDPLLLARAQKIRALILDVDGVLTDGRLYYTRQGESVKVFFSRDGFALKLAQNAGIRVGILSGRGGAVLRRRLHDLGVDPDLVVEESRDKAGDFARLCQKLALDFPQVAYMGDDIPDLAVFSLAGLALAPADAPEEVRARAHVVVPAPGGKGAVREAVVFLLKAQGIWNEVLRSWERRV